MGKYLIRIESMDGRLEPELEETYGQGIECDGFCIIGDTAERNSVAIHHMSVDSMSAAISGCDNLLSAAILAKAKREIIDMNKRKAANALNKLFSRIGEMDDDD